LIHRLDVVPPLLLMCLYFDSLPKHALMIKIMIADDHQMFIDGIKALLKTEKDIEVVGEALNGKALLAVLDKSTPDIVLMDINMPEMDGIEATKELAANFPHIKVIMLSMHANTEFVVGLIESGASGYILKNTGKKELTHAIRSVHSGSPYFSEEITASIMSSFKNPERTVRNAEMEKLTEREKDVLKLIASEFSTKEIADKLFISTNTVETHRKNLFSKLKVKNLAGLVKYALQTGLIS
jgi:two-component system, NarL family, nitrate/nitrite response regulator NarL